MRDSDTPNATKNKRTTRLPPEERKEMLVRKAADFFSKEGFDAGTRVLAQQMGITQPLIYRYFDSKDDLINEVYRHVYVGQWQDSWTEELQDRARPLRDRLMDFYASYCPAIFNERWMRIFFFAGLKGLDINTRYINRVAERLLRPICHEIRAELGYKTDAPITEEELELVWLMHGMVFYQGIREKIYHTVEAVNYEFVVQTAVDMYLRVAPEVLARAVRKRPNQANDAPIAPGPSASQRRSHD